MEEFGSRSIYSANESGKTSNPIPTVKLELP